jgi:hypothetical protein
MWINEYFTMTTQTIQGLQWIYNIDTPKVFTPSTVKRTTKEKQLTLIYHYNIFWIYNKKVKMKIKYSLN